MTLIPGSRTLAAALATGALLLATSALPAGPRGARAHGNGNSQGLQVLTPVSYKNLTIFPVRGPDQKGSDAYITLDEGTKAGTVVITEKGGGGQLVRHSARGGRGSKRSPTAAAARR